MIEMNTELSTSPQAMPEVAALRKMDAATQPKLKEASQDFEAVFLKQFLGQALKPLLHDTPGSKGAGAGVYQHMITDVIAKELSSGGDFGFSTMLQAQLADQTNSETKVNK